MVGLRPGREIAAYAGHADNTMKLKKIIPGVSLVISLILLSAILILVFYVPKLECLWAGLGERISPSQLLLLRTSALCVRWFLLLLPFPFFGTIGSIVWCVIAWNKRGKAALDRRHERNE